MNQYTTVPFAGQASVALTHDKNGNTKVLPFFDDAGTTVQLATATYDYRNQMVGYERDGMTAEYRYDALGRRTSKTLTDDGDTTTTFFLYRGDQVVEEREAPGGASQGAAGKAVTATYVHGNGIDEVVTMHRNGEDYFYHSDDQGTIWAVTDESGAVAERYDYEDYGRSHALSPSGSPLWPAPNLSSASGIGNRLRYTGREFDEESGLYWYRTRYYDARAGRFTSRDTIGIWGDPANLGNGSAYVGNNPGSWVDPWGLDAQSDGPGQDQTAPVPIELLLSALGEAAMPIPPMTEVEPGRDVGEPILQEILDWLANHAYGDDLSDLLHELLDKLPQTPETMGLRMLAEQLAMGRDLAYARAGYNQYGPLTLGEWTQFVSAEATRALAALAAARALAAAAAAVKTAGVLENGVFAQRTYGQAFGSEGRFAGQTIDDLAEALRSGAVKPADVPIQYVVRDGNTLILNTRSAKALQQAGIPRSQWNAVNMTGEAAAEARLTGQLQRNGLDSTGILDPSPGGR